MDNYAMIPNIRIRKIIMTDFRNISHAEVEVPGGKISEFLNGEPSILGLYGQNGSGKTSLLMAINALKYALSGTQFIFSEFSSCIRSGCSRSRLEFEFSAYNDKGVEYEYFYAFSLSIEEEMVESTLAMPTTDPFGVGKVRIEMGRLKLSEMTKNSEKRIVITDELLQIAGRSSDGKKLNKQTIIDTSDLACKTTGKAFGNKTKYDTLTMNLDRKDEIDSMLSKAKLEANIKSMSFIFMPKVRQALIMGSSVMSYKLALSALSEFGTSYLFVVLMSETAFNNIEMLPLSLWLKDEGGALGMVCPLPLFDNCIVPELMYMAVQYTINSISEVISKIVPNLKIEIEDKGSTLTESGQEAHVFYLYSMRNGIQIPLLYESDGIKRIISFLSLLVAAYNNPSVTVAIDEMDSGIFEYMLGELLDIMKSGGKGQLIFSSHNLRPLEVLPYKNLLFTTINPEKRFSKLEGISGNNNLRDSYFRSIILGSGKDAFYDATDSFEIEKAIIKAGLPIEEG